MEYTETYLGLCHGTDINSAKDILKNGFQVTGDKTSWCGPGVYFYDIKAKAWWAAKRKCGEKRIDRKGNSTIVFADIVNVRRRDIFDLRVKENLEDFEQFTMNITNNNKRIRISQIEDDNTRIIELRAMLISYYVDNYKKKLVVGNFRQRPQPQYEHAIEFANALDMVFGIETIYCVKDTSIISHIYLGGSV